MHPVVRVILQALNVIYSMRIATSITGADYCYFSINDIVNTLKTIVIKAEFKAGALGSLPVPALSIRNGAKGATIGIKEGSIVCNNAGTSPYTHVVDTSAYHVYKIVLENTTQALFYVDDVLVHTAPYANLQATTANYVLFGDGSAAANTGGTTFWRSVSYNADFVSDPNNFEEWLPVSKPTDQGWSLGGTDLATIIEE